MLKKAKIVGGVIAFCAIALNPKGELCIIQVPSLFDLPAMRIKYGSSLPLDFKLCGIREQEIFHAVSVLRNCDVIFLFSLRDSATKL